MNHRFTKVESIVLESTILSSREKLFYCTLKSFRNNRNKRCFPSIKKVVNRMRICEDTGYRCRKKLQEVGLISWNKTSGGRRNHCEYNFTLEDGSKEEQEKVTAILKGKKTTLKEGVVKLPENMGWLTTLKEGVVNYPKRRGTNKKNNNKKNFNNNKEKKAVVEKDILNLKNKLKQLGVKEPSLSEILKNYSEKTILQYLRWLPNYREILKSKARNEAGVFISAIKNNRGAPEILKRSSVEKGVRGEHTTEEWEEEKKRLKEEEEETERKMRKKGW